MSPHLVCSFQNALSNSPVPSVAMRKQQETEPNLLFSLLPYLLLLLSLVALRCS
jgi:hypothetical protein